MTFLLFLASLAVMEYLLSRSAKKPEDRPQVPASGRDTTPEPASAATSMPGLLALGQALDAQGRVEDPTIEQVPEVHGPPMDGV